MESKIMKLIKYIASNAECESPFLNPEPEWTVNANDLLHEIVRVWGIPQSDVSKVVSEAIPVNGS